MYKNISNKGLMKSLNLGISYCKYENIIILGQDDLLAENHIESLSSIIERCFTYTAIFCDAYYLEGDMETNTKVRGVKLNSFGDNLVGFYSLMKWNYVVSTGICINKKVLEEVGLFDTSYKNHGEWLTWLKLSNIGPFIINRNTFSKYRKHQGNITNVMFHREFYSTFKYYSYVNFKALMMKENSLHRVLYSLITQLKIFCSWPLNQFKI